MGAFHDQESSEWWGRLLASRGIHHGTVWWLVWWIPSYGFAGMGKITIMACSHCWRGRETKLSCLVANCVHTADETVLSCLDPVSMSFARLDPVSNLQLIACSHYRHGRDKTVCLVRVGSVNKLLLLLFLFLSDARYCYHSFLRVYLSACLWHWWFIPKRLKVRKYIIQHMTGWCFCFYILQYQVQGFIPNKGLGVV